MNVVSFDEYRVLFFQPKLHVARFAQGARISCL